MAKDYEDGVWRTIGGRRIFIKDGQSMSDAMKASGKFKNARKKDIMNMNPNEFQKEAELEKKVAVEKEKFKEEKKPNLEKAEELERNLESGKYKNQEEAQSARDELNKIKKDWNEKVKGDAEQEAEKKARDVYMSIPEEERIKAYEEGKNWKDLVREKGPQTKQEKGKMNKEGKEPTFEEKREYLKQKGIDELNNFTKDDDDTFIRKEYDRQKALEDNKKSDLKNAYDEYVKKTLSNEDYLRENRPNEHLNNLINESREKRSGSENLSKEEETKKSTNDIMNNAIREKAGKGKVDNSGINKNIDTTFKDAPNEIKTQVRDIQSSLGTEVEDAQQVDRYGMGISDRFMLKDNENIPHGVVDHSLDSFGKKEDKWSYDMYFHDEEGRYNNMNVPFNSYDDMINNFKDLSAKGSSSSFYQKAFQQYKKEHPNSKLNLNGFVEMTTKND